MQIESTGATSFQVPPTVLTGSGEGPARTVLHLFDAVTLESPAANLVSNPSFEIGTSGWTKTSGATLTRTTLDAVDGSACAEVACFGGVVDGLLIPFPATIDVTYTVSAWVRAAAGRSLTIRLQEDGGGKSDIATRTEVQNGEWRRMHVSGVTTQTTMRLRVDVGADDSGFTFYLDGAQAEASGWASSYAGGSLGSGYAWTATAHASASTREGGQQQRRARGIDEATGGFAAFLRPHWGADEITEHVVFHRATGPDNGMMLAYEDGDWLLSFTRGGTQAVVTVPAAHQPGDQVLLTAGWAPRGLALEVDGAGGSAARVG